MRLLRSVPKDFSIDGEYKDEEARYLLKASGLFQIFKFLFVDLILSRDGDALSSSKSMFTNMGSQEAFGVIEIELNFMYDLLYTKGG